MLRSVLAGFAGMLAANAIVFAAEYANSLRYPFPPGMDLNDHAQCAAFIQTLPADAFVAVWLAWAVGAFVGTLVTRKLTPGPSIVPAVVVVALFEAFCLLNMLMLPHPIAFVVANLVTTPLAAFAALKLGAPRPPAVAA
jgi:hypothetical protein